jgi:hypothetical protein
VLRGGPRQVRLLDRNSAAAVALVLLLSIISAGLVVVRWQSVPPEPYTLNVAGSETEIDGFYPAERSGERAFRWSRPYAGITLPAFATTQVVSITVNPAREGPIRFRLFLGVSEVPAAEFTTTTPEWRTYTATVKPGIGAQTRIILETDSFYPGGTDPRRLGLAVSDLTTSALAGRFGLINPPLLLLLLALALPSIAYAMGHMWGGRTGIAAAVVAAPYATLWTYLADAQFRLPGLAWLVGLTAIAALLLNAYRWSRHNSGPYPAARRVLQSRWELPAVALGMLGLTLVLTWPLVTHLDTALPSWPGDSFTFLYKIWWFREALGSGQWPLFDPNTYAPFGFDLGRGEPTLLNNVPGALIAAIWNEPVAYNLLTILSFVISGLGAYLLGRGLTGSRAAGLLAGVAFAFCAYRWGQYAGHFQLLGTGWLPLMFYFTERTLKTRRLRDGALAGLMFALTALTAWYYAFMAGLLFALYLLVRLLTMRPHAGLRSLLAPAAAGVLVAAVLVVPVALPQLLLYRGGELRHSEKAADSASAAPIDYAIPNPQHPLWGELPIAAHRNEIFLDSSLYIGLVPFAVGLFAYLIMRRRGITQGSLWASWLVVAVTAFVLSLGLTLHDPNGQYMLPLAGGGVPVPLPGQLLFDYLPLFSSMRAYARFGVMVALAAAVILALGWLVFLRSERFRRRGVFFATAALVVMLADLWTAPYVWGWSRVEPTQTAQFLRTQPRGTIMQMPLESSQSGPAFWQVTNYGMPIAYGFDTFEPPEWGPVRDDLEEFPSNPALDALKGWGVRYIVVSANAYEHEWETAKAEIDANPRLRLLASHIERRIWFVDPAPLDARPDMRRFVLPDTLVTYELVR